MSSPTVTLQNFIKTVPVCNRQANMEVLLGIIHSARAEEIVVVDRNEFPIGKIAAYRLTPYLIECLLRKRDGYDFSSEICSLEIESLIEPIAVLPALTHLNQFGIQNRDDLGDRNYALIDSGQKFVGLLDSYNLLKYWLNEQDSGFEKTGNARRTKSVSENREFSPELARGALTVAIARNHYEQNKTELSVLNGKENDNAKEEFYQSQFERIKKHSLDYFSQISPSPSEETFNSYPTAELEKQELNSQEQFITETWKQQQLLYRELAAKNIDLNRLNQLKDEFLNFITHEFKSPLTAIRGSIGLLKEKKLGELNLRQSRYIESIDRSTRQLMALVNDILNFSGLETEQIEIIPEPVKTKTACWSAYEEIEADSIESNNSENDFSLEIEAGLETIVADRLRLHQMLVRLLKNALKLTLSGGKIGLRVNRWRNWVVFTVWDTGVGIPEADQNSIFQKCQHRENSPIYQIESITLGSILTRNLARAHGGDLSFLSRRGRGNEFTLLLPWSETAAQIDKNENRDRKLILIAESIPSYIEDLSDRLIDRGYGVIIARSGTETLEKARQLKPDAIFLNPSLPTLSGWDVLNLLKSDPSTKNIPVVITATNCDEQHSERDKADGFLLLPLEEGALRGVSLGSEARLSDLTRSLKILHLHCDSKNLGWIGSMIDSFQLWNLNHRILEADSLEQAEMLARIWKIDAIVFDRSTLGKEPLVYLQALKECQSLAGLPLVTLDAKSTEAANQVSGLSVFPCLFAPSEQNFDKLLEVIRIAARSEL